MKNWESLIGSKIESIALNTRYNEQQKQLKNGGIAMACGTKKTGGKKPPKK